MKKITFLLMFVVSFGFSQITIGTSDNGGAFESPPINPYYGFSYGQSIYLASELNSTGDITSVEFQLNPDSETASADEMVDVWIGHTSKTSFDSTSDWVDVSTLTQVLANGTITSAGDVLTITFDTSFTYNGTDNLIIAVDANEPGYDGYDDSVLATDGPTTNMSLMHRSDDNNNDPLNPTFEGALFQSRGNITFNGISTLCAPASATASIVEDCDNSEFSILVDVTDLGDSTNLEITNDAGVASTTVSAIGEVTVGPFPVGTGVVLTLENENNDICDVDLDSILDLCPTDSTTLDFYNLQYPTGVNSIPLGSEFVVYAKAYEDGLTNVTNGQSPGIEVWIGYNLDDTDPSTEVDWTWIPADFNVEVGNDDEYRADIANGLAEGTYYYASRFRFNEGPYTYGGAGGAWNSDSGELTITPPETPGNDECSAAEMLTVNADLNCTVVTAGTTAGATASAEDDAGTSGTPNTDVWYSFVATAPAHRIELSNIVNIGGGTSVSADMGMTLYDATSGCAGLVFVSTSDPNTFTAIDLVPGTTYFVRVYGWGTEVQNNNFDICIGTPDIIQGSYCTGAIVVGTLPYTDSDNTENFGDDYGGAPGTDCGNTNLYLNGDDVVYEYTATLDAEISISLTNIGSNYVGVFAYDDCADIGSICSTPGATNGGVNDDLEFNLNVTNGETYYIMISTWATPQSTAYTLNIKENTCTNATVDYTIVNDCVNSGGFLIDVEVTDLGSATDLTITNNTDATVYNVDTIGTYQFGPYTNGTNVVVTVSDDNDGNCIQNSGTITQIVCPPNNINCSNAETVVVGVGEDGPTVVGTNDYTGGSGVADPSCNAFYEGGDVWYEFTVPVGATEVYVDVASSAFSSIIAVLYDNCTDMNEVSCETIFSSAASFNMTGLTGGSTYYLRLYDFGNDSIGLITFNINTPALSIDDFDALGFKYFPNPVTNALTLKAQKNIQNVTVSNMLGQEVLRMSPNTLESNLDMSSLNTGSYFVKVTINNATETVRVIKN